MQFQGEALLKLRLPTRRENTMGISLGSTRKKKRRDIQRHNKPRTLSRRQRSVTGTTPTRFLDARVICFSPSGGPRLSLYSRNESRLQGKSHHDTETRAIDQPCNALAHLQENAGECA